MSDGDKAVLYFLVGGVIFFGASAVASMLIPIVYLLMAR